MMTTRRSLLAMSAASAALIALPASAKEDNEANKASALRFIDEVFNQKNLGVVDDLVSPAYESPNPDDAPGIDALRSRLDSDMTYGTFLVDDAVYATEDTAVKSPNVFVRGVITGSSQGKKISAVFFAEFTFSGGLIAKHWLLRDQTALMGL